MAGSGLAFVRRCPTFIGCPRKKQSGAPGSIGRHFSAAREERLRADVVAPSHQDFCVRALDCLLSRGSALGVCGRAGRCNGSLRSNGSLRIREPADTSPLRVRPLTFIHGFRPQRLDGRPGRSPADPGGASRCRTLPDNCGHRGETAGCGRFLRGSARTRPRITCPLGVGPPPCKYRRTRYFNSQVLFADSMSST